MAGPFSESMLTIELALSGIAIAGGIWWAAASRGRFKPILLICLGLGVAIIPLSDRDLRRLSTLRMASRPQSPSPLFPRASATPRVRGFTTPREVSKSVKAAPGSGREFEGLAVHWNLRLLSANRQELMSNRELLLFSSEIEAGGSALVVCDVEAYYSYQSSVDLRFIVHGVIQRADALEIHLKDVQLEPVDMAVR